MEYIPLIKCLRSEALTESHWADIKEAVGGLENFEKNNEDLKLEQMIEHNVLQYFEAIEDITVKAQRQFNLQKQLKQMKDEMRVFNLQQHPHKSNTWVLKAYDEVNGKLDDQIVATQTMLSSQYMGGPLKKEAKNWESKLIAM